jgi:diguanylate cyclase (GGDEF)-like protein
MPIPIHEAASSPPDHFKRTITLRYVAALSLVAALAVLSHIVFHHVMATIERSAEMTAVTGSQRLLIQRVLAQCLLLAAADDDAARRDIGSRLSHAVDLLEENHKRLLADLENPESFASHAPDLAVVYLKPPYELDKRMRFFIATTRDFSRSADDRPALSDPQFRKILDFGESELLRDLNAVVLAYQRRSLARLSVLHAVEAGTTSALLLLLAAVGYFLMRPMVRRICEDRESLQRANKALAALAVTDNLTGAYNRRKFDQVMRYEIKRTRRYQEPFSVIMLDIDHFKNVNDVHGHLAGDDMLRELTQRVAQTLRDVDWLFRYGGEEFVVAAPHTDLEHAAALAEKLREKIAATPFPHDIPGSVSLGVAQAVPDDTTESLMQRVDAALYAAKEAGRNRVVTAPAA